LTKFLVVFDVDSTLIEDEAIELLADHAGTRDEVAAVTDAAMRGELDFAESLSKRVATLAGLPEQVLGDVAAALRPTPGAAALINEIHARGGLAAAVSGGFIQLLDPLRKSLDLDFTMANTLEIENGKLTGRTTGQVVTAEVKRAALIAWREDLGLSPKHVIAVGDGANDLLMLAEAGLGVAFDAKPVVRAAAQLALNERDLSKLVALLPPATK
jgi:phosphoserine phosphatase